VIRKYITTLFSEYLVTESMKMMIFLLTIKLHELLSVPVSFEGFFAKKYFYFRERLFYVKLYFI